MNEESNVDWGKITLLSINSLEFDISKYVIFMKNDILKMIFLLTMIDFSEKCDFENVIFVKNGIWNVIFVKIEILKM